MNTSNIKFDSKGFSKKSEVSTSTITKIWFLNKKFFTILIESKFMKKNPTPSEIIHADGNS